MTLDDRVGIVAAVNVSSGGVPKNLVESAYIGKTGLLGDSQRDTVEHGGPYRAVSMWALEVIKELIAEGHPIFPGAAGENLTILGLPWQTVKPGQFYLISPAERLISVHPEWQSRIKDNAVAGELPPEQESLVENLPVLLWTTGWVNPCHKISEYFKPMPDRPNAKDITRIHQAWHPGSSRIYAQVVRPGWVGIGSSITQISDEKARDIGINGYVQDAVTHEGLLRLTE